MFICENCRIVSEPVVKPKRVVTQKRTKSYVNYRPGEEGRLIFGKPTVGWEIVKETNVCNDCFNHLNINQGALAQKESK